MKKKVLHIITRMDMGGSAQNTMITCLGLADQYDMVLIHGLSLESKMTDLENALVNSEIEKAKMLGVKTIPLPALVRRIDPVNDIKAFISLFRWIKHERPSIVHTHTSKAGFLGRWAAKLAKVPVIVHTPHGHVFYGHFPPVISRLFLQMERLTDRITDQAIALTEREKKDYIERFVHCQEKIVTIHSGVDIDRHMDPRIDIEKKKKTLGLNSENLIVGTVGWLIPIKGPVYLLNAMDKVWKALSNVDLVYVGKGDLRGGLEARAAEMGASDKVTFLGWRDDVHEIIPVFDLFVLPSLNEGMGRVLVEAMAAGKPVVASHVGGISDLVKHNETGVLVPPGNTQALSQAILHILKNPKRGRKMGSLGKDLCRQFSIEAMIENIDNLYKGLLI